MARQDYTLTVFDADANECRDENGDLGSAKAAARIRGESITDVFVMSHGWNGDVPSAVTQYNGWTDAMFACHEDLSALETSHPGFKPLLVGFHWPSLPWGNENAVPSFAIDPTAAGIVGFPETPEVAEAVQRVFREVAAAANPRIVPPALSQAYHDLDTALHLGTDREPFNPQGVVDALASDQESFAGFDIGGLLTPLRTLSFWYMKARAQKLGESAGASLVKSLQAAGPAGMRIHLMGHSFGCIVVSSIASAVPVASMVLVQGAMSLWSFSPSGFFHSVWTGHQVRGPIVTTQSQFDTAVKTLYPIAAGVAHQVDYGSIGFPLYGGIGTFGIQGVAGITAMEAMLDAKAQYVFQPGQIYNVRSDNVIRSGSGLMGAHCDLLHPEVGHLVWQAAMSA